MVSGIPRLTRVERVAVGGAEVGSEIPNEGKRATGSEDEIMGLLVRRLCIRGFFWRRVIIPKVSLLLVERETLAASSGEISRAEEAGGKRVRQARSVSIFSR